MDENTYSIARCDEGWSLTVHGARLTFETLEAAKRTAEIAGRTERLHGRRATILIEQEDGTWLSEAVDERS